MPDSSPQADRQSAPPQVPPRIARSGPLARLSIDQKLPLLIASLLLAVIAALVAASYVRVRATSEEIASERLAAATTQLRDIFQGALPAFRRTMALSASQPAIKAYAGARVRTARLRDDALASLRLVANNPGEVVATELRDRGGRVLLTTGAPGYGLDTVAVGDVLPSNEPGDSAAIGLFRTFHDTIVYPTAKAVPGSGDTYLVRWRRLNLAPRTREAITRLVGAYGTPYLGSPNDSTWTNFERPVPPPRLNFSSGQIVQSYRRDNTPSLAGAAVIGGTPWAVVIDVPMSVVLTPANDFLRTMLFLALLAVLVAIVVARLASRRITRPLLQLTEAATAITGGDFSRVLTVNRADELGELGRAFSAMATEVQNTRANLESRVHERTRDLNDAMQQLHDAQESLVRRERLALLGQLASGVGHELRNPLGVMTNSVYYLRMVLTGQSKDVHEYLDILHQQIALSEKIVGDLLDFARSKPPQRKPTSIAEVCGAQLARLGAIEGVVVESSLNGELPAVLVDAAQAGQIVLNLLTNAMQAMDGPGVIRISAHANDVRVQLDIADSGPGVPVSDREKVFEPLFTTKARGIGLGLAVSRTLARANGGDLVVADTAGGGAVFRLTLPTAGAA